MRLTSWCRGISGGTDEQRSLAREHQAGTAVVLAAALHNRSATQGLYGPDIARVQPADIDRVLRHVTMFLPECVPDRGGAVLLVA
ncbi:hypothetical protein ACFXBB_31140 [Streptomyces scopuliridis]|uniref:hypothetical protein n=1 Tax=Streptomyces scopuliridis TaxID=452529 RepID=UPI0036BBBDB9